MSSALQTKLSDGRKVAHLIVIGTKPDIIKQAPIYHELVKRNELVIVCHTGQHYDYENSQAILKELGIAVDVNFLISGSLNDKMGRIIQDFGKLVTIIRKAGKIVIPYVHGDTLTASGAALGSILIKVAPVHIEAGIRTMTPKSNIYKRFLDDYQNHKFSYQDYVKILREPKNYRNGSFEPFPEQINTRMIDAISAIRFAPCQINADNIERERNISNGIVVVGNTISDAVELALKQNHFSSNLATQDFSDFIFFSVHRRETCEDARRFAEIIKLVVMLLMSGYKIFLISQPMLDSAIKKYAKTTFINLESKFKDQLIVSKPIPFHSDTIKIIKNCRAVITDSGGLQEETQILNKKCLTLRYGTDRIETIFYGNNILVPPIRADFMHTIINNALSAPWQHSNNIYQANVAKTIVDHIMAHTQHNGLFRTEEQRMELQDYV